MLRRLFVSYALTIGVALTGLSPRTALAQARSQVVFTFDISSRGLYEQILPLFSARAMRAVVYAETGPLDSGESWVMSYDQLRSLQNAYGWEIGSHTITHPNLTTVSDAQLDRELVDSRDRLASSGLRIRTFATPYGAFDARVLAAIARNYESHRAAWGGPNTWPTVYDDYQVRCYELQNTVSLSEARGWVDEAVAKKQTLVLLNHGLVQGTPAPYEYNIDDYAALLDYVATRPIAVTTMSEALTYTTRSNLLGNGSFNQTSAGWATGWRRSDTVNVILDANGRGAYPEATYSVKLTGGAPQSRLISPDIAVTAGTSYVLRVFQNAQALTQGGWAVWVDEFVANRSYLGGQWLGRSIDRRVGNRYFTYAPSPGAVSIHFTIYTEANAQGSVYVDAVDLRAVE